MNIYNISRINIREMDSQTIVAVVKWLKNHHDIDESYGYIDGTPAEMWIKFCANYSSLYAYDEESEYGPYQRVNNGCAFFHDRGQLCSFTCGNKKKEGSNHCAFHSQIVFSEPVIQYLKSYHESINNMVDSDDDE